MHHRTIASVGAAQTQHSFLLLLSRSRASSRGTCTREYRHLHLHEARSCKHATPRRGLHSSPSSSSASASTSTSPSAAAAAASLTWASKNPTFTSFFFHNSQWMSTVDKDKGSLKRQRTLRNSVQELAYRPLPSPTTSPANSNLDLSAPFSPPLSSYKAIEAPRGLKLLKVYNQLAKSNLTILVVLTSMSGVALSPFTATGSVTLPLLLSTALGTVLCSASANTLNQLQEIPFDAQMARTRNRPFVRRAISPLHGLVFGVGTGVLGTTVLWAMAGMVPALLGAGNVVLYAGVYTWMKRRSVWNTWVGAVVGGIPPLIGWTACGGRLLPDTWSWSWSLGGESFPLFLPEKLVEVLGSVGLKGAEMTLANLDNPLAPFAFFMFLFSWQFFHFMPLSHLVRQSYAQAGYKMLSVLSPRLNALVALRHTLLLIPICSVLFPVSGMTTWWFAVSSLGVNAWCVRGAWRFWRRGGEREARVVFQQSLWYLPVVMGLMMVHKTGMDWLDWLGIVRKDEEEKEKEVEVEDK